MTLSGIDNSSLTDRVHRYLRQLVLARELKPGEKVDVDRLARNLGVSRTPVKDALNRLAAEGLVTIRSRRGTYITSFEPDDLQEMLEVRQALEAHAARMGAPNVDPSMLERLRATLRDFERDFQHDSDVHNRYEEFLHLDRAFHHAVAETAGVSRLVEMVDDLNRNLSLARVYLARADTELASVHAEHRAILTAFERRDGEAAAAAVAAHLNRVKRSLIMADRPLAAMGAGETSPGGA